jgi:hypothetical protein
MISSTDGGPARWIYRTGSEKPVAQAADDDLLLADPSLTGIRVDPPSYRAISRAT